MLRKTILTAVVMASAFSVQAEELSKSALSKKFQSLTPFKITAIEASPIENTYQVVTESGVFYLTKDGKYIFSGSIHKAEEGLPNLTKARLAQEFKDSLSELKESFVTFDAPNEKHEIVVFYDANCGFCQRLHEEVPALNAQGVTVHYAGWPRDGVNSRANPNEYSSGYKTLQSMWCSASPKAAFNRVAEGAFVEPAVCETKIETHFKLGEQMGVRGTPAVFSITGEEVSKGAAPAARIVETLESL
ncbi:hypothetical protein C9975_07030 [Thalassospira xiamenensis]|nr:hypothetical protein C9975_07030 [Thalassospira xiamenensis]